VSSRAGSRCSAGRAVKVFGRLGGGRYRFVGTTNARLIRARFNPDHGLYRWNLRDRKSTRFYVQLAQRAGCGRARSPTTAGLPRNPRGGLAVSDIPLCPSTAEDVCHLETMHFDTPICPGFTQIAGNCDGSVNGTDGWTTRGGGDGHFLWEDQYAGGARTISLFEDDEAPQRWALHGWGGGPRSPDFAIGSSFNLNSTHPEIIRKTPAIGPAGEPGGPLHLDFKNGTVGADVYIRGYLYRAPDRLGGRQR